MFFDLRVAIVLSIFAGLSIVVPAMKSVGPRSGLRVEAYLCYLWTLFLLFTVAEVVSFRVAVWILAPLCFVALREYFSLLDIRLQDRWGIWGAYLSIPFMVYFIQIDWYGMFIISIPVYAFLAVSFLIALGSKEADGTVFSIGAINYGLFLFVYCTGHIAYLALFSTWMAIMLLANVAVCDLVAYLLGVRGGRPWKGSIAKYVVSVPATVLLTLALTGWTGVPRAHAITIGMMIPLLAAIGRYTIVHIESDLGITRDRLVPGRGRIIDSSASSLYAAPIVFHYIRYFLT